MLGCSRPRKLELFGYLELCLICAESYYKLRYSNLRASLGRTFSNGNSEDLGAWGCLLLLEKYFFSVSILLRCFCCICMLICGDKAYFVTAGQLLPRLMRSFVPESALYSMPVLRL